VVLVVVVVAAAAVGGLPVVVVAMVVKVSEMFDGCTGKVEMETPKHAGILVTPRSADSAPPSARKRKGVMFVDVAEESSESGSYVAPVCCIVHCWYRPVLEN